MILEDVTVTPMAGGSVLIEDDRLGKRRAFTNADGRRRPPKWVGLQPYLDCCAGDNWVEKLIDRNA